MNLRIPRRTWRTPTAVALAAAAVVSTLTATAAGPGTTATASPVAYNARPAQGDCHTYDARGLSGFNVGVCINDHATGTTAYPDIYVNTARHLGLRESCRIDIETWDDHNHKLGDTTTDCTTGHHTAQPVKIAKAATVHAFARLRFDGSSYPTGDSPSVSLAANAATPITGSGSVAHTVQLTRQFIATPGKTYVASPLLTAIKTMNAADLNSYLQFISDLNLLPGLDKALHTYYSYVVNPPVSRVDLDNAILSKASAARIALVEDKLRILQPDLSTGGKSRGVDWVFGVPFKPIYDSDGKGKPNLLDAYQGSLNDCYFHAELLSLAMQNPSAISKRLTVNSNGTVTITFGTGKVTITQDLPAIGHTHPYGGDQGGTWIALFEKAYAQLKGGYPAIESGSWPNTWKNTGDAYRDLTGHQPTKTPGSASPRAQLLFMADRLSHGNAMVTSTTLHQLSPPDSKTGRYPESVIVLSDDGSVPGRLKDDVKSDVLDPDHEYVVTAVDVAKGTVDLANPWGTRFEPFRFRVSADVYRQRFMDVAIVQP